MIAQTEKSRDELLKESRLLYQKINKEMKRIKKAKEPLLEDALNRFNKFRKEFKYNSFSKYSDDLVKDLYRDLKNISSLKSSTLEGAIESAKTFGKTRDILDSLSEESQGDFWRLYNKLYKNLEPKTIERYKYELFDVVSAEMLLGQDLEDTYEKIKNIFDKTYGLTDDEESANLTEAEKGERFAEQLKIQFSDDFENLFYGYY